MKEITRNQRDILEKDYGLKFNKDIYSSHTKSKKYYLVETKRNLSLLDKIKG